MSNVRFWSQGCWGTQWGYRMHFIREKFKPKIRWWISCLSSTFYPKKIKMETCWGLMVPEASWKSQTCSRSSGVSFISMPKNDCSNKIRAGKIRFSGIWKVCALKSKFATCAPCDRCLPHCVPCHIPNEIDYGKITFKTNSDAAASIRTTSFIWRN